MDHKDLLAGARSLVSRDARGKPKQADLRRAQSAAYYALFHTMAKCCADLLIGGKSSERSKPAWRQVYRALEHGHAKSQCKAGKITRFPKQIEDFANMFVSMQTKRHAADYDPDYRTTRSEVTADIDSVETAISDFKAVTNKDKRAFAAWVLFRPPRE